MAAPNSEDRPASNWPTITEQQWYTLAIVAVIFTAILAFFVGTWVFTASTIVEQGQRVAVVAPFGAIPFAVITFCTVAWRGMVTSRQADQQRFQADQQRRQNDATDDANYAKLLQEGAKLLADEKSQNQLAGIASLSILLNEPKARYRAEAINILAETVRAIFKEAVSDERLMAIKSGSLLPTANALLEEQALQGFYSNLDIRVVGESKPKRTTRIEPVSGFKSCIVTRGRITRKEVLRRFNNIETMFRFVSFHHLEIKADEKSYLACEFFRCAFKEANADLISYGKCKFIRCDFSGCVFSDDMTEATLISMNVEGCWYDADYPPRHKSFSDWEKIMERKVHNGATWISVGAGA